MRPVDGVLLGAVLAVHAGCVLLIAQASGAEPVFLPPQVLQVSWMGAAHPNVAPVPASQERTETKPKTKTRIPAHAQPAQTHPLLAMRSEDAQAPSTLADQPAPASVTNGTAPATVHEVAASNAGSQTGNTQTAGESAPNFHADYLSNPAPAYPRLSRELREQGRVLLRVFVAADGHATDVRLHQSSGFERLDDSAIKAVRTWKFVPARLGTEPVAAWVVVPIEFALKSSMS